MTPPPGEDRFTVFVVLPWETVCSVRGLPSGVTLAGLACRLELLSGCPAHTYRLVSSEGRVLREDQPLVLARNVWDGFVVRLVPLEEWQAMYEGVLTGDLDTIVGVSSWEEEGGRHKEEPTTEEGDEEEEEQKRHGSTRTKARDAALYLSSWFGHTRLCTRLLYAGADPNALTPFNRSAMFASVVKDNDAVLDLLLTRGGKFDLPDVLGETVLDVAKRSIARQCINRIRSFQGSRIQNIYDRSLKSRSKDGSDVSDHGRVDDQPSSNSRPRLTKSAKIISVHNNDDLFGKREDSCGGKPICKTANRTERGSQNRPVTFARSVTSLTPRTPRHAQEAKTTTTSLRSTSVISALRVAQPVSCQRATSGHAMTSEAELSPSNQSAKREGGFSGPCYAMTHNGFQFQDLNSGSWRLVGQACSPRQPLKPPPADKAVIDVPGDEAKAQDEDVAEEGLDGNVDQQENDSPEETGTEKNDEVEVTRQPTMKKPWQSRRHQAAIRARRESVRTAKRRIQLSEHQKRTHKSRETFQQWLKRKRRQESRGGQSSDLSESSSDEDEDHRRKANAEAFDNWIKDLGERSARRVNPRSAVSLLHRKTRAIQGLIGIDNVPATERNGRGNGAVDVSGYMHSYKAWQDKNKRSAHGQSGPAGVTSLDDKQARRELEAIRHSVLAEAVTFEEWLHHMEERKRLTKVISDSKREKSAEIERSKSARSAKRNLPFEKWKQDLEAKEAKRKIAQLRIRRHREEEEQQRQHNRNSTAIPHHVWVQKKQAEATGRQPKQQTKQGQGTYQNSHNEEGENDVGNIVEGSEKTMSAEYVDRKGSRFEAWVNKKHAAELEKVDRNIRKERRLLQEARRKSDSLADV